MLAIPSMAVTLALTVARSVTMMRSVAGTPVHTVPTGALYSILLVLHVAASIVGFGALATTGLQASRARRGPGQLGAESVRRFFRPGVNWVGRVVYAVPVLGFALVGDSRGAFSSGDAFVVLGFLLWAAAVVAAETVVWPAERRVQLVVTERWGDDAVRPTLERDCTLLSAACAALVLVFVVAVVVMVGKP